MIPTTLRYSLLLQVIENGAVEMRHESRDLQGALYPSSIATTVPVSLQASSVSTERTAQQHALSWSSQEGTKHPVLTVNVTTPDVTTTFTIVPVSLQAYN